MNLGKLKKYNYNFIVVTQRLLMTILEFKRERTFSLGTDNIRRTSDSDIVTRWRLFILLPDCNEDNASYSLKSFQV